MRLEINPQAKVSWHPIGDHGTEVLEVEDFLANAEEVRQYALDLDYDLAPRGDYYPGRKALASVRGSRECVQWVAERALERLFPHGRPPFLVTSDLRSRCTFAMLAFDWAKRPANFVDQHTDNKSWLATVLHLSHECEGRGTAFWEHRPSGMQHWFEGIDAVQIERLEQFLGLRLKTQLERALMRGPAFSMSQLGQVILHKPRPNRTPMSLEEDTDWRLLAYRPAAFNRLVAFPTWQLHSIVDTSRHPTLTVGNVRLTLNQFAEFPVPDDAAQRGPTYPREGYVPVEGLLR